MIVTQLNPDVPPTGSDLGIVNAARKSFGKRSDWEFESHGAFAKTVQILKEKDKRLLEFLARGMTADDFEAFLDSVDEATKVDFCEPEVDPVVELLWQWRNTPTHDTPFNHGFFSFEVKAPIFVARHLVKHEYLIMSEYSRRYITDDVEFYVPEVWRKAAKDVKQGSSSEAVGMYESLWGFANTDEDYCAHMKEGVYLYNHLIEQGVAPEQARMVLPQSLMTSWTWSGTLGAFANMCRLRLNKDTQYETRLVAESVYSELKKQFPVSAPLLVEGVF
jgi:thymidylate synthase (FAD)